MIDLEFVGPDEAETVSEIAYPLFYEVYGYEPEDVVREFLEDNQSPDAIRRQMSEGIRYAFIMYDGEHAGYVAFGIAGESMVLSKLYLFGEFRGMGIGTRILQMIEDLARSEGISAVRLDVNVENSGALRLYERSGYVAKGRTGPHNRRLVMEKRLDTDL